MIVGDAVFAQGAVQFVHADVLFRHVRFDDLSVMDQQAGLSLDEFAKATKLEWINSRVRLLGESFATATRRIEEKMAAAERAYIAAMQQDTKLD